MKVLLLSLLVCAAQEPQTGGATSPPVQGSLPAQENLAAQEDAPQTKGEESIPIEARLATLFEGALADSKNGEPFAETPGYVKLITSLAAYKPEEVSARATADLDYAAVMADPDRFRGEFVRVRAIIAGLEAHRLDHPIAGSVDVYRGVVAKADGSEGVWFDMLERPPQVELKEDVVELEGVFYRTVSFENKKSQTMQAPWLIVRNFTRPDPDTLPRHVGWSSGALFGKVLLGLVLAYFAGRLIVFLRQQSKQRTRSEPRQGQTIRQMMLDPRGQRDRESPRPPRS